MRLLFLHILLSACVSAQTVFLDHNWAHTEKKETGTRVDTKFICNGWTSELTFLSRDNMIVLTEIKYNNHSVHLENTKNLTAILKNFSSVEIVNAECREADQSTNVIFSGPSKIQNFTELGAQIVISKSQATPHQTMCIKPKSKDLKFSDYPYCDVFFNTVSSAK